jgi:hypothetical protein
MKTIDASNEASNKAMIMLVMLTFSGTNFTSSPPPRLTSLS